MPLCTGPTHFPFLIFYWLHISARGEWSITLLDWCTTHIFLYVSVNRVGVCVWLIFWHVKRVDVCQSTLVVTCKPRAIVENLPAMFSAGESRSRFISVALPVVTNDREFARCAH